MIDLTDCPGCGQWHRTRDVHSCSEWRHTATAADWAKVAAFIVVLLVALGAAGYVA